MQTLWRDMQYSLRMPLKNPGFTAFALLMLALDTCGSRFVGQFPTEGALLAIDGGTIVLAVAYTGLKALVAANPNGLPFVQESGSKRCE